MQTDLLSLLNQVHEGDCLELMQAIPDASIDMILCDLPYGYTSNKWDKIVPLEPLWEQYERIINPHGAIVLTAVGKFSAKLICSNEKLYKYKWVWSKKKNPKGFLLAKYRPLTTCEEILIFCKAKTYYAPQMREGFKPYTRVRQPSGGSNYGTSKSVSTTDQSDGKRYPIDLLDNVPSHPLDAPKYHPTQKPVNLGAYFVRTYTQKGDIILDNACGSGSFLLSALIEGRNFIGMELNQNITKNKTEELDCVDIATTRIQNAYAALDDATKNSLVKCGILADADLGEVTKWKTGC